MWYLVGYPHVVLVRVLVNLKDNTFFFHYNIYAIYQNILCQKLYNIIYGIKIIKLN